MDIPTLLQYAPKAFVILIGVALTLELRKYKRKNDTAAWLRDMYARIAKASQNEEFRKSELADTEKELEKLPKPDPIAPITGWQQMRIAGFPKMLFMTGLTGCVFIYLGLFEMMPSGIYWPVYAGWGFLAVTVALYWSSEKLRPYYRRSQQVNKKYLLQKTGKEPERIETLKEVLEYYPELPQLWLELGDQLAAEKRIAEAVEAVRKARTLPANDGVMDLALVEASFQLRGGNTEEAEKLLDEAETMKTAASDPRICIYRGAVALQKSEKKAALRYGKEALDLDGDFTETLLGKDEGLTELRIFWDELLKERENKLLEEAAKRQEERKTGEKEA